MQSYMSDSAGYHLLKVFSYTASNNALHNRDLARDGYPHVESCIAIPIYVTTTYQLFQF